MRYIAAQHLWQVAHDAMLIMLLCYQHCSSQCDQRIPFDLITMVDSCIVWSSFVLMCACNPLIACS
jgi:hypothetical protein